MGYKPTTILFSEALSKIEMMGAAKDHSHAVTTGFISLDKEIGGFTKGEMVLIGGRPGMGKTGLMLSSALNMVMKHKIPVGFISMESPAVDVALRIISLQSNISMKRILSGKMGLSEIQRCQHEVFRLNEAPLLIRDFNAISITSLEDDIRQMISEHGIRVLFLDHIQILVQTTPDISRVDMMNIILEKLKRLTMESKLCLIASSQLSRSVETRGGSRMPKLFDLRDSGALEEHADKVIFIYRPEYYGLDYDDEGNPSRGIAFIKVAKNRSGLLADVPFRFSHRTGRFFDTVELKEQGGISLKDLEEDD